jgi:hypothetical protein
MTDLEMTRRCAEKMGLELIAFEVGGGVEKYGVFESWGPGPVLYDPLHNDAQAMDMLRRFPGWVISAMTCELEKPNDQRNFNRAICECVAKMSATGSGGGQDLKIPRKPYVPDIAPYEYKGGPIDWDPWKPR